MVLFYVAARWLKLLCYRGEGERKDNSGSNPVCACRELRSHFPFPSVFTAKLQGGYGASECVIPSGRCCSA